MSEASKGSTLLKIGEAVSEINKAFFGTIRDLFVRPKNVLNNATENSNSQLYTSPFRFLFIITSFYLVAASWLGFDLALAVKETNTSNIKIDEGSISILENSIVFISFLSWIPASWVMSKLFSKSKRSSGDCYLLALYIEGQALLGQGLLGLPIAYFFNELSALSWSYLVVVPYFIWVYKKIFSDSLFSTIWKTLLTILVNFLAQMIIFVSIGIGLGMSQHAKEQSHSVESSTAIEASQEEKTEK